MQCFSRNMNLIVFILNVNQLKKMKFSKSQKVLNYLINRVIVVSLVLMSANLFAQTTQKEVTPTTTAPVTTTPQTTPITINPNGKDVVDVTPARVVTTTAGDVMAKTSESNAKAQTLAGTDPKSIAQRKRIFGYNLFNTTKFDPTPAINIATPSNYVLGTNDQLLIDIYGYSQDYQKVTITPDGYITLPKVGIIYLAGSTVEQAKQKIINKLSKVYIGLNSTNGFGATYCNVSLGNVRSIKVNVTGEAVYPGTYTVSSFTSLLNILYICGGPNEIGTYRQIHLIRQNKVVLSFDLYDILLSGYSKNNVLLQDQDIIQIGTYNSRVSINGFTKRNGLFEVLPNEKLDKVLGYAGGFDQNAYTHRLKIHRNTSREFKIFDITSGEFPTFNLTSGDSIVVEKILDRYENQVTIDGAVYRPGKYSLDANQTLTALIKSAEGLKNDALKGRVSISRINEQNLNIENVSINLDDIFKGKSPDIVLKREDQITIPSVFTLTEPSFVRIQGAINNPAGEDGIEFPYIRNMTIEDLLVKVGGITEAASLSRVEVVRRKRNADPTMINAEIADIFYFNIRPDLGVEEQGAKFILFPYDEIFIRTSPNYVKQTFVMVEGEVIYPSVYGIMNKDEKISDIIKRAGGLTPFAYLKGATLLRKVQLTQTEIELRQKTITNITKAAKNKQAIQTEELNTQKTESIDIDLTEIINNPGGISDMRVKDGDVLSIPKALETVRVQGEVLYPTSIKYVPKVKFMDYISKSGGYTKKSLRSKSYVIYANGSVDRTRRFFFVNVYPKIEPGSEIIVPERAVDAQQQLVKVQGFLATIGGTITTALSLYTIIAVNKLK